MTIYRITQVVGTSHTSFSDAVRGAVGRAAQTLDDIRWFEVKELRGRVDQGEIAEYQVKVDVAFHLHNSDRPTRRPKEAGRSSTRRPTAAARSLAAQTAAEARRKSGRGRP